MLSVDLILSSWRGASKKQYASYIQRWIAFCTDRSLDIFSTDVVHVLDFLSALFNEGLAYSAINTARSALSTYLGINAAEPIWAHPLVIRFMKGVSRKRPTLPRYKYIWDVNVVLDMFRKQPFAQFLSLYDLTLRTVTLLALVSAQRGQTIHMLDLDNMTATADSYCFTVQGDFKQSRPGNNILHVILPAFESDPRICIVRTLSTYLYRTRSLRKSSKLFVSTNQPHGPVSKDTISRWIKSTLRFAGIDVSVFMPHSTRAAATSAAQRKGVNLSEILTVAGWSNATTFARFYNKPLRSVPNSSFADSILRI